MASNKRQASANLPPSADIADSLVRCLPEDGTNGFFVACFVKDEDAEPIPAPPAVAQPVETAEAVRSDAEDGETTALPLANGKKGGKQAKKAKSTGSQAARIAKDEVLGKAPEPKPAASKEAGAGAKKADKKLSKKQLYLLKKEELKRKKAETAADK